MYRTPPTTEVSAAAAHRAVADMSAPDNQDRVNRARRVLKQYVERELGEVFDAADPDSITCDLSSLLADLHHLCDDEKAEFSLAIRLAQEHHAAEVQVG